MMLVLPMKSVQMECEVSTRMTILEDSHRNAWSYGCSYRCFFRNLGEQFDDTHILNKVANDDNEVVMFVNGQQNFDYENYVMKDGDVIEIEY